MDGVAACFQNMGPQAFWPARMHPEHCRRAGLSEKDGRLPDMFHKESLSPYHETVPYPEEDLHGTLAAIRQALETHE
jgi:hypothetical protein